jgi:prephenate dehydrogenase
MFNKLCVIGVGLIGGSVAKAARAQGLVKTIVGVGREQDAENLQTAKQLGVIDEFYIAPVGWVEERNPTNPNATADVGLRFANPTYEAVKNADCVLIATPVASIETIFEQLKPYWSEHTLYTDVGSTKSSVLEAAEQVFGFIPNNLVPAHPIAGAEQSGVAAALVDLFNNRRLIITPTEHTKPEAVKKIEQLWQGMGALVSIMDAKHHDSIFAATSHLPHILAFALVDMLGHQDEQTEIFKYAAGGFKDFTRIASSDPSMWKDICKANKHEILPLIEQLKGELAKIQQYLVQDDYEQLYSTFAYAKLARQRFLEQFDKQS